MKIICLLFFALASSFQAYADCARPCTSREDCAWSFYIGFKKVDFYSNYSLLEENECIKHIVVAVHGTARDAWSRFDDVGDAVRDGGKRSETLILAPFFKTDEDILDDNDYFWSDEGWKKGNTSNTGRSDISSFEVTDLLLDSVINSHAFDNLNKVTITGHSAGGQYTQLYALNSPITSHFPSLDFSFLVLNPSNYSYLNDFRPHPTIENLFEVPVYLSGFRLRMKSPYNKTAGDCPNSYNDYKYGLNERNIYSNQFSKSELIEQFLARDVHYFLGSEDRYQDSNLDTSCSAKIQGKHRLERGLNFFNFLNGFFPGHNHQSAIVAGVGHDAEAMYESASVKDVLLAD